MQEPSTNIYFEQDETTAYDKLITSIKRVYERNLLNERDEKEKADTRSLDTLSDFQKPI